MDSGLVDFCRSPEARANGDKVHEAFKFGFFSKPFNLYENLGKIGCKTGIIHGTEDPHPLSAAEKIHASIPGSNLCRLENCGHFPFAEQPSVFNAHLQAFLELNMLIKYLIPLQLLLSSFLQAAELRAFCNDTQTVKEALLRKPAVELGEYAFTDFIYRPVVGSPLKDAYIRIRLYEKTNWKHKIVVLVHKEKDLETAVSKILLQVEYDQMEEAIKIVAENFMAELSFARRGWEYSLRNMQVYVEEIEGIPPSIEVIAPSSAEIMELFQELNVTEIWNDSVPEYMSKHFK